MAEIKKFTFNPLSENTYLVFDESREAVVVDPGFYFESERSEFFSFVQEKGLILKAVLLTHGHIDHITGIKDIVDKYGVPVYMNSGDEDTLRRFNKSAAALIDMTEYSTEFETKDAPDGLIVHFGGIDIKVLTTPGHSPGSVCWHISGERILFTGDTLFAGTIGRTDFPFSSLDSLLEGLRTKILPLDGDTVILPGHGGESSIGKERVTNPFITGEPELS